MLQQKQKNPKKKPEKEEIFKVIVIIQFIKQSDIITRATEIRLGVGERKVEVQV